MGALTFVMKRARTCITTMNASVFTVPRAPAGCSSASPFRGGGGGLSALPPAGPSSGNKLQPSHVVDFPDAGSQRLGSELGVKLLCQLDAALLFAVDRHELGVAPYRLQVSVKLGFSAV